MGVYAGTDMERIGNEIDVWRVAEISQLLFLTVTEDVSIEFSREVGEGRTEFVCDEAEVVGDEAEVVAPAAG